MSNTPKVLIYSESDSRCVNGIDFSQCMYIPDFAKPHRVKHTFRIGNAKVPRWLYELTLDMAMQIDGRSRGPSGVSLTRSADGKISVVPEGEKT